MTPRAIMEANPAFQAMKERDAFTASLAVTLQNWQQLDAASWWCEELWREHHLHYRRRVWADQSRAVFEFRDDYHAVEFLMRFGSRCRNL